MFSLEDAVFLTRAVVFVDFEPATCLLVKVWSYAVEERQTSDLLDLSDVLTRSFLLKSWPRIWRLV